MDPPFPITPALTGIAMAYRNETLIADEVLPRKTVGSKQFKWYKWTLAEGFTLPDTKVGRRSSPNEMEFTASEQTGNAEDFGLDDPVPQEDIEIGRTVGLDPLGTATEGLTDLILLDREKRVADLVFALNTYPAANRVTLAGNDQWSDYANSDPIDDVTTGLDAMIMRANIMVIGRAAFTKLASHPKIIKAVYGNAGDAGIARRRQIAELFELEDVLVGEGWINTAKKGQAVTMSRVWGKHCALIHRNRQFSPGTTTRPTFGFTGQWLTRIAGAMPDSKIGLRGGQRVRVGESVDEIIAASDLGYFIQNAVA